jgi:hypothetical protein
MSMTESCTGGRKDGIRQKSCPRGLERDGIQRRRQFGVLVPSARVLVPSARGFVRWRRGVCDRDDPVLQRIPDSPMHGRPHLFENRLHRVPLIQAGAHQRLDGRAAPAPGLPLDERDQVVVLSPDEAQRDVHVPPVARWPLV